MFPLGCAAESPYDQVMIRIVPGILDVNILEHMLVCYKYVVRLGPHLLATMENTPHPVVPF